MSRLRVLVQAGHADPREPGFERGTGTAGEIELVTAIAHELVTRLDADPRFDGIYSPGDIPDGIKVEAAVFLHGDGSANRQVRGYSFGFPGFAVNKRLADLIAKEFQALGHPGPRRRDNYTADLAGYYGYRRVDTAGPEVLIEHGFLTHPEERAWLFEHETELAHATYRALLRHFKLALPPPPRPRPWYVDLPGPRPKPDWFWDAIKEADRRRGVKR